MKNVNKLEVSSFLAGLFTGAVIGGVATLFLTPTSGKETRKKTKEAYDNLYAKSNEIIKNINNVSERLRKAIFISKQEFATILHDIQHSISTWKKDAENHQELIQKQIKAIEIPLQQLERSFQGKEN